MKRLIPSRFATIRTSLVVSMGVIIGLVAGCAIEWQNRQPAQQLAQANKLPGSIYTGWRVFQDKCASCHGANATGLNNAPDLTVRMREMGANRFVSLVLKRYDWGIPTDRVNGQPATMDALVEAIIQRKEGDLVMPAWQSEARVNAHIMDLYVYLSARSDGTQGPGRPTP